MCPEDTLQYLRLSAFVGSAVKEHHNEYGKLFESKAVSKSDCYKLL